MTLCWRTWRKIWAYITASSYVLLSSHFHTVSGNVFIWKIPSLFFNWTHTYYWCLGFSDADILEKAECDVPHLSRARKQETRPPEEGPQEQRVPQLAVRGEPVHITDVCDKKRHEVSPGQAPHSDARGGDPVCEEGTACLVLPLTDFSVWLKPREASTVDARLFYHNGAHQIFHLKLVRLVPGFSRFCLMRLVTVCLTENVI